MSDNELLDMIYDLDKKSFMRSESSIYLHPNIPMKKLVNAIASYANYVNPMDVMVLIDETLFGSAKEGMLLTQDHLYFKGFLEDGKCFDLFDEIDEIETITGKEILINGHKVITFTQPPQQAIKEFCDLINDYIGFDEDYDEDEITIIEVKESDSKDLKQNENKAVSQNSEFLELLKSATLGDVDAQFALGQYYISNNKKQDAIHWIKQAAQKEHPHAVYLMATFYELGVSVEENQKYAFELFKLATILGFTPAIYKFGYYLFYGIVEEDKQLGLSYMERAAQQGYADAENEIAVLCIEGDYVKQDIQLGLYWWERAAEHGSYVAQFNLGLTFFRGELVGKDYTRAFELLHLSAAQGYSDAASAIGAMYLDGLGVARNQEKALEWLLEALELDCHNKHAMTLLYKVNLQQGVGGQNVFERFTQCLKLAAQENNAEAQNILNSNVYKVQASFQSFRENTLDLKSKIRERARAEGLSLSEDEVNKMVLDLYNK